MMGRRFQTIRALMAPDSADDLIASLLFLVIVVLACFIPAQNDTWWNLAAGREMWERHAFAGSETFSWTARGNDWPNHEWLAQVAFYGAWRLGGLPLLTALAATLASIACLCVFALMRGPLLMRALLLFLLVPLLVTEWALRPRLFTTCLLAVTTCLLVTRQYKWLPPLFALWSNLHGGVAIGIVAVLAATLEGVWRGAQDRWRLAACALLSILATGINPLGFSLFSDVVLSLRRPDFNWIQEWQPAGTEIWHWPALVFGVVLLILTVRYRRELDDDDSRLAWIGAALAPLGLRHARNLPLFCLVTIPLLSRLVARREPLRSLFPETSAPRRAFRRMVVVAVAVAAIVVGCAWSLRIAVMDWDPMPPAAVDAVRRCPRPMYNHFDNGGYLIWFVPEQPVFIDSRQHPYPAAFVVEHLEAEARGEYRRLLDRYGFRCAVLPPTSRSARGLAGSGWSTAFRDDRWIVLHAPATGP
jgi:hypothetical protein